MCSARQQTVTSWPIGLVSVWSIRRRLHENIHINLNTKLNCWSCAPTILGVQKKNQTRRETNCWTYCSSLFEQFTWRVLSQKWQSMSDITRKIAMSHVRRAGSMLRVFFLSLAIGINVGSWVPMTPVIVISSMV